MTTHVDHHQDKSGTIQAPHRDPVCGMTPSPETPHRLIHDGEEVLFCSAGCKAKFNADPLMRALFLCASKRA